MKLIVGLGNPGEKYENTRHNVGFMFVDALASQITKSQATNNKQIPNFNFQNKFNAEILKMDDWILAKPQTFMNDSGQAVSAITAYYKIPTTNLYVIHDDLDIALGEYKLQKGVGPKDHNGIISIEEKLGSSDFWRVRIGIENRDPENRIPGEDYVLMKLTQPEKEVIDSVINETVRNIL